jgi:hypothetical protein
MHRWKNVSTEKPGRMIGVMSSAEAATVAGKQLENEGISSLKDMGVRG